MSSSYGQQPHGRGPGHFIWNSRADNLDNVVCRCAGYNVPRYTSYPTAADFTTKVTAKEHVHNSRHAWHVRRRRSL
jgi:hypothetical protein